MPDVPIVRLLRIVDDRGDNHRMADLPIACTLSPAALKARRDDLLGALLRCSTECSDLPNGLRLCFAPGGQMLADVARAVDAERQCCRFLSFTITVDADGGPITLDLTGPPGTREFLSAMFGRS